MGRTQVKARETEPAGRASKQKHIFTRGAPPKRPPHSTSTSTRVQGMMGRIEKRFEGRFEKRCKGRIEDRFDGPH